MDCIVAAQGLTPARHAGLAASVAARLGRQAEVVTDGTSLWLGVVHDDGVVGAAHLRAVGLAVMGTGLRIGGATAHGAAAEMLVTGTTGRPSPPPDDAVAVAADTETGTLRAVVSAGWHRLFVGEPADGGTIVCSNLALLAHLLGDDTGPDRSLEDFLLGFGFLPGDHTVHRRTRVLHPGTHEWGSSTGGSPAMPFAPPPSGGGGDRPVPSFEQAADELHGRFMAAIDQLAGDRADVAVLLGGFDSALVAAALAQQGRRVTTYTFGFGDPRFEQRNVDLVTKAIGSTERWVHITPDVTAEGLREFGRVFASPGAQPHYQIHTLHACRRVRADGFDAVFTGDGCDAIFLGYPTVSSRAGLVAKLGRVPRPLVAAAIAAASTRPADRYLGHVARMVRSTLGNLRLPMPARGHLPTRYLDDVALARLRRDAPPQDETVDAIRRRLAVGLESLDPVRLAFHGNASTGQSRTKVDGAVAETGLVQHTPFLHPGLKAFVGGLPVEFLRPEGSAAGSAGKAVLIEMIRRHRMLPDEVVQMPKQSPAEAPVDDWYTGPLRAEVFAQLEHLPFEWDRGYVEEVLRPKFVERLYRDRVTLSHHTLQVVGLLASYASFHRG